MGCRSSREAKNILRPSYKEFSRLASETPYAFKLYDLRRTGYIEREELKEMVLSISTESDLKLANDAVETIVDKTILAADTTGDREIYPEEWKQYVEDNPSLLSIMSLPYECSTIHASELQFQSAFACNIYNDEENVKTSS